MYEEPDIEIMLDENLLSEGEDEPVVPSPEPEPEPEPEELPDLDYGDYGDEDIYGDEDPYGEEDGDY